LGILEIATEFDLKAILIKLTDEMLDVLNQLTVKHETSVATMIETILRRDREIKKIRTEWPDRPTRGRPAKPKP
jgi:hypothetical protein